MNELIKFYMRGPMKGLIGRTIQIQLVEANTQQTMRFLEDFFSCLLGKRRLNGKNLNSIVMKAFYAAERSVFQGAETHIYFKAGSGEPSYALLQNCIHGEENSREFRVVLAEAISTNSYITFLYGEEALPYYGRPTKLRENGFQLRHSGGYRNYRFNKIEFLRGPIKPQAGKLSDLHLNGVLSSPTITLRFDDEGSGSALVRLAYADKLPPEHVREWSYERMRQKLHWIAVASPIYESYVAESRSLWET